MEGFPYFTEFLLTVGSLDYFNDSLKRKGECEQAAINYGTPASWVIRKQKALQAVVLPKFPVGEEFPGMTCSQEGYLFYSKCCTYLQLLFFYSGLGFPVMQAYLPF